MLNHSVLLRQLCLMSAAQEFIVLYVYKAIVLTQRNTNPTLWKEREMVGFYVQTSFSQVWRSRSVFKPCSTEGRSLKKLFIKMRESKEVIERTDMVHRYAKDRRQASWKMCFTGSEHTLITTIQTDWRATLALTSLGQRELEACLPHCL